jgi:hypothetical protein
MARQYIEPMLPLRAFVDDSMMPASPGAEVARVAKVGATRVEASVLARTLRPTEH